nr:SDR family oxidoreductase [uncultured Anaeromusa sp.]
MSEEVLITGGMGYVGGRIAQAISEHSAYDLTISTRRTGLSRPEWLVKGNVIKLDLLSEEELDAACQGVKYIIHLAALNEIDSAKDPEQALIINGLGTLKLLRAAERAGVERFIYFSTAHVYGAPLQGNITENLATKPCHPYAITHRIAEDFVLASSKLTGIVLRLSNSLGAPSHIGVDRWTLLVNDLCRQAVTENKLTLRTGHQRRDFIALSDVCAAVLHFLKIPKQECKDGLFNLGGECTMSVADMAELISERYEVLFKQKIPIYCPEQRESESDVSLNYDISKLKETGFKLQGDIVCEVDRTLEICNKFLAK